MSKMIEKGDSDRRQFLKRVAGVGALGTASGMGVLWPTSDVLAQAAQGFRVVDTPMLTGDESRVEVLEFFWFGCPHCYAFEPTISKWIASKPDYVDFVREAPPLNPAWEQHSRTFYAAEALGITDGMFDQVFNRIHKGRKPMRNQKKIGQFVESLDLGVSSEKFIDAMNSFAVNSALKRSISRAQQAGVSGVPSVVINGKYLTGNTLAGSHQGIINVIDQLAESEHNAG
ncbi:MAG: thiol:disulfide interchange protein DsbA/DsbL [Granulosicoccaceae bacterium]